MIYGRFKFVLIMTTDVQQRTLTGSKFKEEIREQHLHNSSEKSNGYYLCKYIRIKLLFQILST